VFKARLICFAILLESSGDIVAIFVAYRFLFMVALKGPYVWRMPHFVHAMFSS
jgi:hypothetical protein